jgi:hypothetical protein
VEGFAISGGRRSKAEFFPPFSEIADVVERVGQRSGLSRGDIPWLVSEELLGRLLERAESSATVAGANDGIKKLYVG